MGSAELCVFSLASHISTFISNLPPPNPTWPHHTPFLDMLTNDGSIAIPLDFDATVPLGDLAELSLALTWFNISGIDSFNGLTILEPLDPYSLATR